MVRRTQTELFEATAPIPARSLSEGQRLDWLRLMRTSGVGPVTFRDLLNHFGSAAAAIEAIDGRAFGRRRFDVCSPSRVEGELEQCVRYGARMVCLGEPGYPRYLQTVEGGPPILFVKGDIGLSDRPAAAIVGSRQASGAGRRFTQQISHELGELGFTIVSGLARGIDTSAHHAALESGTIAVLGGGLDHIYPAENRALYQAISEQGLIVSEQPMGYRPTGKDFPRRNRLISGISLGVVIMEAAVRSGSLTTARFAGEQGRLVFAVPGHPLDPRAAGTNKLIRDGALLVSTVDDIAEELTSQIDATGFSQTGLPGMSPLPGADGLDSHSLIDSAKKSDFTHSPNDLRQQLLELMGPTPIERDGLVRLLGCEPQMLQILLLELDLEGRLEHHGGQKVSLLPAGQG